ncbi:RagB/SusD family nutrient uptake outer membrane protein [Carboxylicivirga taeanensis]|uniref:RagB/SusD family nutrient uptake outer membrane protein n=1 Tax=Carboxylicivirga taeanensis TaxID=1416875 RepID=UPI003F6E12C5
MKKIKFIISLFIIALLFVVQSCSEDFLVEYPTDKQAPEDIQKMADVEVVINGTYNLMQSVGFLNSNIITRNDMRSDDMQVPDFGRLEDEYRYDFDEQNSVLSIWSTPYTIIRQANNVIAMLEGINVESPTDKAKKDDMTGQSLTIRALAHFSLCNSYGLPYAHNDGQSLGIPIVTEVLPKDAQVKRSTVAQVYDQIIKDLTTAIPLLSEAPKGGKINSWAAKTLLARVYLYKEDNTKAYETAVDVIKKSPYVLLKRSEYVDAWSKEFNSESIFSCVNNAADNGGGNSIAYLSDPEGYGQFIASQDLIDLVNSDPDDIRNEILYIDQLSVIGDPTTYGRILKYPGIGNTKAIIVDHFEGDGEPKPELASSATTSNVPIFRLSELYLIAAEAAVKGGGSDAATYLNAIVERANPAAKVAEADVTLDRVLTERRKELMAEGHRFFDLIRNKRDIVRTECARTAHMTARMHIPYDDYQVVFAIPLEELKINPLTQNPGY